MLGCLTKANNLIKAIEKLNEQIKKFENNTSDAAKEEKNALKAFGNVRMEQGDTLFLFGDYLDYDGDANLARVRDNVRLEDKTSVLETDSLDYNRNLNLEHISADLGVRKTVYNANKVFFRRKLGKDLSASEIGCNILLINADSLDRAL